MRNFMIIHPTKCDSGDQIKENEVSVGKWNVWGRGEMHKRFYVKPQGRRVLEKTQA
jgi:hypothetical protein